MPHAVLGDQVPGGQRAERTGTAGDQNRAVRRERGRLLTRPQARHPSHVAGAVPHDEGPERQLPVRRVVRGQPHRLAYQRRVHSHPPKICPSMDSMKPRIVIHNTISLDGRITDSMSVIGIQRVALERTGHAVPAATALAQLEALDLDHLDPRRPHAGDGVGVALVGHDHAGLEGDDVVAVVPLLALLLVLVTAGLDDLQPVDADGVGDGTEEVGLDRSSADVLALLPNAYMFRPGYIHPMNGERPRSRVYRVLLPVIRPLYPVLRRLMPRSVTTTELLGRAMVNVADRGAPKRVLETPDINAVGVPFIPPDGSNIMAFNCGGPSFLLTRKRLVSDLGPRLVDLVRNVEAGLLRR